MSSGGPSPFRVGVFVLAFTVIGVAGLVALGLGGRLRKAIHAETYVDESVQGLEVGSPVKQRGKQIGKVSEIAFVRSEYARTPAGPIAEQFGRWVVIRMEITDSPFPDEASPAEIELLLSREIRDGLRARLAPLGITGLAYVEVDYIDPSTIERAGPLEVPWEPASHYVPSAPSTISRFVESIDEVFSQLRDTDVAGVVDRLDRFLAAATRTLGEIDFSALSQDVSALLEDLRATSASLRERLQAPELDRTLAGAADAAESAARTTAQLETDLPRLLEQVDRIAASLGRSADDLEVLLGEDELGGAVHDFRRAAEALPETLARLRATFQRLDLVLSGGQADASRIFDNLRQITDDLRDLTELAKSYPSLLLFGDPPPPR